MPCSAYCLTCQAVRSTGLPFWENIFQKTLQFSAFVATLKTGSYVSDVFYVLGDEARKLVLTTNK